MLCLVSFRNSDRLTVIMSLRLKSSHHQDLRHSTLAYFIVLVLERFLRLNFRGLFSFSLNVVVIVSMFTVA